MNPSDIRTLRRSMHLTQAQLAERLGVTRHSVCRWEHPSGRWPINPTAARLLLTLHSRYRAVDLF